MQKMQFLRLDSNMTIVTSFTVSEESTEYETKFQLQVAGS